MSGTDGKLSERNVLNAVASVRAGQEQMQKDVDKLRAGVNAMIMFSVYAVAIGALIFWAARKGISR